MCLRVRLAILVLGLSAGLANAERILPIEDLREVEELRYANDEQVPFTGTAESYFEDGSPKLRMTFNAGVKEGLETAWYEDGRLRYQVRYKDGLPQGLGSSWYSSKVPEKSPSNLRYCEQEDLGTEVCGDEEEPSSEMEFDISEEEKLSWFEHDNDDEGEPSRFEFCTKKSC